jgi:hypothetical protein
MTKRNQLPSNDVALRIFISTGAVDSCHGKKSPRVNSLKLSLLGFKFPERSFLYTRAMGWGGAQRLLQDRAWYSSPNNSSTKS